MGEKKKNRRRENYEGKHSNIKEIQLERIERKIERGERLRGKEKYCA